MKLEVRAFKIDAVKLQLLSLLQLEEVNIVAAPSNYGGITILNLDESAVSTFAVSDLFFWTVCPDWVVVSGISVIGLSIFYF